MTNLDREHAVIIHLKLSDDEFGSFDEREAAFALEDRIDQAITSSGVGEYDGHEFGQGWCKFYIYGRDAGLLTAIILPVVKTSSLPRGSYLAKRSGPAGTPADVVMLSI